MILDNHYHLLGHSHQGEDLPRLMQCLHGGTAHAIAAATGFCGAVWWSCWDYCPRDEADYRARQNDLYYNPVKHGYVTDLRHYPHSTFSRLLEAQGRETLAAQFRRHPEYRDLRLDEDQD